MSRLSRPFALAILLLALGVVTTVSAFAQDSAPLTLEEYWTLVQDSQKQLAALTVPETDSVRAALDSLAARWEAVTAISLDDGQTLPLDTRYIVTALRTQNVDVKSLSAYFKSLLEARAEFSSLAFGAKDLDPLKAVLARPEFQWPEAQAASNQSNWFQKLWDRFTRWLDKILGNGNGLTIRLDWFPFFATILLLIILVVVFRDMFAGIVTESALGADENEDALLTSEAAFSKAQSLSRGGDYRSAVRYLYLSSLLMLDERGLMRYDRSRTNREYLRSVADDAKLAEPLKEVVDVFDNVWYGYHKLDEESFRHYSGRVEELKEKKE